MNSVRINITDKCPWNCWWCHNEGTGNRQNNIIKDVDFFNDEFFKEFLNITNDLHINEIHLTGGEPSLHPDIDLIIKKLKQYGFKVKMTSMGTSMNIFKKIVKTGIDSINFSLHAINDVDMIKTQIDRSNSWIAKNHQKLLDVIKFTKESGVLVKINTVIADEDDYCRVLKVVKWAAVQNINVRILNEVNRNTYSINAIRKFFNTLNAVEIGRKYVKGSSTGTISYFIPKIGEIDFKVLVPNYLPTMCNNCIMKKQNLCGEYFYGIRIENLSGNYYARLCIHKTESNTYFPLTKFKSTNAYASLRGDY